MRSQTVCPPAPTENAPCGIGPYRMWVPATCPAPEHARPTSTRQAGPRSPCPVVLQSGRRGPHGARPPPPPRSVLYRLWGTVCQSRAAGFRATAHPAGEPITSLRPPQGDAPPREITSISRHDTHDGLASVSIRRKRMPCSGPSRGTVSQSMSNVSISRPRAPDLHRVPRGAGRVLTHRQVHLDNRTVLAQVNFSWFLAIPRCAESQRSPGSCLRLRAPGPRLRSGGLQDSAPHPSWAARPYGPFLNTRGRKMRRSSQGCQTSMVPSRMPCRTASTASFTACGILASVS
jgi:hypothetical protein